MKLIAHFDEFLSETVNLNKTRLDQLDSSIVAIKAFIRGSAWSPRIREFAAQGSWAHKTIIRPIDGSAFDADLLVYVDPVDGWEASDYINELHKQFRLNGTYKDKARRYSHCVTIEYVGERKIDIAPCIKNRGGIERYEVCNKNANQFELSAPLDYTNWLILRNTWSGSNSLRKATRLLKYLRDIKTTFTCPSFLLTTLLGYMMQEGDKGTAGFADVPTTLKTLMGRLDNYLQRNNSTPTILNPVLHSENMSSTWSDTQYSNFRDCIHRYREWIDDAYDEQDRLESIGKWQRVFGDEFAGSVALEEGRSVSVKAASLLQKAALVSQAAGADLVAFVRQFGSRALPPDFVRLPYMRRPRWKQATSGHLRVTVQAALYRAKNGFRIQDVASLQPLPRGVWIRFEAYSPTGIPADYRVMWRVTNTDDEAYQNKQLRGDFYKSDEPRIRWESLKYHGVHMVEAFVVRKRDDALVGQSEPYYVVIE